jgi:hypothetical protein
MGNTLVRLMLSFEQIRDDARHIDNIVATYAAYADAIEHVLGAPSHFLYCPDARVIREWLDVNDETPG